MSDQVINIVSAVLLMVGTFVLAAGVMLLATRAIRYLAFQKMVQNELYATFYDRVSLFLKLTNDEQHKQYRDCVMSVAEVLSAHAKTFAQQFFLRKRHKTSTPMTKQLKKERELLSPEAKEALSTALAAGLVASTYALPVVGILIRAGMKMEAVENEVVVHQPEHVLDRYGAMKTSATYRRPHHHGHDGDLMTA